MGDMNKMSPVFSPSPAAGFAIKSDRNLRFSFQLLGSYNPLSANTKYSDGYVLPSEPNFPNIKQFDFSLVTEFNFLPYESYNTRKYNFSPFVFAGLGTNYSTTNRVEKFPVTIPFGLGIKYNIFERFSIGIQWMAKKTFYDDMDGIVNISDPVNKPRIHNDDWYHHGFLFLTYKPFRKYIECPTYED
jgi:hypothetical protein